MNPKITVQILNWNRAEDTLIAIESAKNQTYNNIEIVVVDNGSTDNSINLIRENYPELKLIELDKNYGCPGGRNLGIKHCSGDYIFYLDNDGILHHKAVMHAFKAITSAPNIGIVTGKVYDFKNKSEIDPNCAIRSFDQYPYFEFQGGICMHDKKIYDEVGYYPPHFMYGAEETFLSLKLHDTTYTILKDESVILWHKQSDIARDKTKEIINSFFNNLYIAVNLYPLKQALLFLVYFVIKYPMYAAKQNILKPFLKVFVKRSYETIKKGVKEREPISSQAYSQNKKIANKVNRF